MNFRALGACLGDTLKRQRHGPPLALYRRYCRSVSAAFRLHTELLQLSSRACSPLVLERARQWRHHHRQPNLMTLCLPGLSIYGQSLEGTYEPFMTLVQERGFVSLCHHAEHGLQRQTRVLRSSSPVFGQLTASTCLRTNGYNHVTYSDSHERICGAE